MRWRRYALFALVALAGLAATAYLLRRQLILYDVATLARDATVVAPHREISWAGGRRGAAKSKACAADEYVYWPG